MTSTFFPAARLCARLLFRSGARQAARVSLTLAMDAIAIALSAVVPLLLKYLIDGIGHEESRQTLLVLALGYSLAWIVAELILKLRHILTNRVLETARTDLVLLYVETLLDTGDDRRTSLGTQTEKLRQLEIAVLEFCDGTLWQLGSIFLRIVFSFVLVLASIGSLYALVLLVTMIAFLAVLAATHGLVERTQRTVNQSEQAASRRVVEVLRNLFFVRAFASEKFEIAGIRKRLLDRNRDSVRSVSTAQGIGAVQALVLGAGLTTATVVSMLGVVNRQITIGDFVQINAYILQFVVPASYFSYVAAGVKRASVALADYGSHLLADVPSRHAPPPAPSLLIKAPAIELRNMSVTYDNGHVALKDISMSIAPGNLVALVGPSGAGKSTLLRALLGLERFTGSIEIDGVPLPDMDLRHLRTRTGYVLQEMGLLERSLEENIAYANAEPGKAHLGEIVRSVSLAGVLDRLPAGMGTLIGEGGIELSIGERQRVLLARALARRPKLLLLDEPTSALDARTEAEIVQTLREHYPDVTRIVAAHRLWSIAMADRIFVLDAGRCVESGTHPDLLAQQGLYAQMWASQSEDS
ncbi:MAG TPA: ABC transporter ATP-binding protein [Burkholderiales bacterium]